MRTFNNMMLIFLIFHISLITVFCDKNFRISKFDMCPPEGSKFQHLLNLSLEQCVDECKRRKHCYAAGYKHTYNLCELYTTYNSTSASRGKCVIVNKDDIQGQTETADADQDTVCEEWTVQQSNGTDVMCSKQECQVLEHIENVTLFGNLNEIGAKKAVFCEEEQVQTLECSTNGKWETGSTPYKTRIQIVTSPLTQQNAREACVEIGGKLVKVDKEKKFDAIEALLSDCPALVCGEYWVDGFTKRKNQDLWKFSDGTTVPKGKHFWKDHAPNDAGNDPGCFRMVRHSTEIGDYRFDDTACFKSKGYICESN